MSVQRPTRVSTAFPDNSATSAATKCSPWNATLPSASLPPTPPAMRHVLAATPFRTPTWSAKLSSMARTTAGRAAVKSGSGISRDFPRLPMDKSCRYAIHTSRAPRAEMPQRVHAPASNPASTAFSTARHSA